MDHPERLCPANCEKMCSADSGHCVQHDTIKEVPDSPLHNGQCEWSPKDKSACTVRDYPSSHPSIDGGYGWVIVLASFLVAFILDGVGSSFGLLFPCIIEKFKSSAFVTSFAGSLFVAFLITGSISVWLVKRFGFRAVSVTGGALSCLAFVASTFSPNIYVFILTFGFLAGCSCGLVFIPSIIIVNEYFHHRRGIANGIIMAGSGAGLLLLAPLISSLLETYSLDGAILIISGLLFNMCVFSSFYRPPGQNMKAAACVPGEDHNAQLKSQSSYLTCDVTDQFSVEEDHRTGQEQHIWQSEDNSSDINVTCGQIFITNATGELKICGVPGDGKARPSSEYMLPHLKQGASALFHRQISERCQHCNQTFQGRGHGNKTWRSESQLNSCKHTPTVHSSMHSIPTWWRDRGAYHLSHHVATCTDHHHSQNHHKAWHFSDHGDHFYLAGSISTLVNLHNKGVAQAKSHSHVHGSKSQLDVHQLSADTKVDSETLIKQDSAEHGTAELPDPNICKPVPSFTLQKSEAGQSLLAEPYISGRSLAKCDQASLSAVEDIGSYATKDQPLGFSLAQLLGMPTFHLFCLGASLIQIGYPLAGTFLADYASQYGLSTGQISVLMGLLGGLNICGRLLAGALASMNVDSLHLNNASLLLGGMVCLLSPLYKSFWSFCIFAGTFGFFLGFFPPLQPLIIVEYFGLDSLASAFGFLSTVKGVASILGAPVAGWIYDASGHYSMSFIFGGVVFVLSAGLHYLMPCYRRCTCEGGICKVFFTCQKFQA